MRGIDHQQGHVFSYLSPEERVRKDHPLRVLREMTDNILREMSRCSTACMRSVDGQIESMIEELITSLPHPKQLTSEERRGMIARYTAVLEGNFIYWMTAAYLTVQSEEARPLLIDNLYEEVRDAHPAIHDCSACVSNRHRRAGSARGLDEGAGVSGASFGRAVGRNDGVF